MKSAKHMTREDELELCSDKVFHYCDSLKNVHRHYSVDPKADNRFCEIEVLGTEISDGEKSGSMEYVLS